jgi:hypothetical protein
MANKVVIGLVESQSRAESVVNELRSAGSEALRRQVQSGNILVSVHTDNSEEVGRAKKALERPGCEHVERSPCPGEGQGPAKPIDSLT